MIIVCTTSCLEGYSWGPTYSTDSTPQNGKGCMTVVDDFNSKPLDSAFIRLTIKDYDFHFGEEPEGFTNTDGIWCGSHIKGFIPSEILVWKKGYIDYLEFSFPLDTVPTVIRLKHK
jgi:hypothetical protein